MEKKKMEKIEERERIEKDLEDVTIVKKKKEEETKRMKY